MTFMIVQVVYTIFTAQMSSMLKYCFADKNWKIFMINNAIAVIKDIDQQMSDWYNLVDRLFII